MTSLTSPTITTEIACGVLAQFEGHASFIPFGGFGQKLVDVAIHADSKHRNALAKGFPGIVDAIILYKDLSGGREGLIAIAKGESSNEEVFRSLLGGSRPWLVQRDQVSGGS